MKVFPAITMLAITVALVPAIAWAAADAPKAPEAVEPLKAGDKAPNGKLTDLDGKEFELHAALEEKPAVLIFYRGSWCPFCTKHLADLEKVQGDLKKLGYQIIAVSPDLPENLKKSAGKGLSYRLASDSTMALAREFGVAFELDQTTRDRYKGFNIDLEKASGEAHYQLPVPAVFVIDKKARITFAHFDPDYKVRMKGSDVVAAAKKHREGS